MADETEKITYEIVIDDSKAVASGKKVADTFKNVSDSSKSATASSASYSDALNKLAPGLDASVKGFGGILNSFKALIASPIGLTLAAVAGAFALIKAAIDKCEPALDFIEDIMTKISTTVNTLLVNLKTVGEFLGNVLIGNLQGAGEAFDKLANEISRNNDEAQKFLDLSRQLEDAQAAFTIANADAENQIKALIIAAKNKNLTFDEAQAKIQQALDIEKKLTDQRIKLAEQEAQIKVGQIALDKGLRQEQNESFEDFVKRITTSGQLSGEQAQNIANYYAKVKQAASDNLAFQEKVQNRLDDISLKRQADLEKELDLARKANEQYWKDLETGYKNAQEAEDKLRKDKKDADELEEKQSQELADQLIAIDQQHAEQERQVIEGNIKLFEKELAAKRQMIASQINLVGQLGGALQAAAGKNKEFAIAGIVIQRAAAIAQIIASTGIANAKAVAASPFTFGQPWVGINTVSAVLSIATTIANAVQSISQISGFAGGGLTGTKIMSGMGRSIFRSNGDNMLATVRTNEVILNEKQQAALGGARTFAAIGVPGFASGGITDTQLSNSLNTVDISGERQTNAILDAIKFTSQKVLVIEDVENLINQRISIREMANI